MRAQEFINKDIAESFGDSVPLISQAKNAVRNIGVDRIGRQAELTRDPGYRGAYVKSTAGIPVTTVPIDKLERWEPASKLQGASNQAKVQQMVQDIKQGAKLPPITVTPLLTGGYRIIDGHHRYGAYLQAGVHDVPVQIMDRTKVLYTDPRTVSPKTAMPSRAGDEYTNVFGIKPTAFDDQRHLKDLTALQRQFPTDANLSAELSALSKRVPQP
jgi:hypothetical protein